MRNGRNFQSVVVRVSGLWWTLVSRVEGCSTPSYDKRGSVSGYWQVMTRTGFSRNNGLVKIGSSH